MTKKELKEAISKLCDIIDNSKTDSPEYKEALEEIKVFQELLRTITKQPNEQQTLHYKPTSWRNKTKP